MSVLLPLPVLIPLVGAGIALVLGRRPRAQRAVSLASLTLVLLTAVALLVLVDRDGPASLEVGRWPVGIGISLVADRLSVLMLTVSATVTLGVLVYAVGEGITDGARGTPVSIFHPTYLVLTAGVSNAFLTGDLFNLYVGFEVLLAASYVLLTLGGTAARVRAGITYVVVSLISSFFFLVGIALVYATTGTLNMAQISVRMAEVPAEVQTVVHLVLLLAFGIKAAIFPLSAWLPDSYPTAAAPVTAVFAGLLTKVGVYAIIRTETLLFTDDSMRTVLLVAAVLTMVVGALGAVAQSDIKRLLSFTLVSHIGYMVFGIALGSEQGLAGALFYVSHHILIQTALFLVVGLVERRTGSTSLYRLGGLAATAPLLSLLFFVPAMNLGGIPPLSGFIGKASLLQAGVQDGGPLAWVGVGAGALTSLLTLYAVAKVWNRAFWRPADEHPVVPGDPDGVVDLLDRAGAHEPDVATTGTDGTTGSAAGTTATVTTAGTTATATGAAPTGDPGGDEGPRPVGPEGPQPASRAMWGAAVGLVAVTVALTVGAGPITRVAATAAENLTRPEVYVVAVLVTGEETG
ncbi:Na+/H+ antiporter subunit D [Aquipuribacter sp. MA13-6]|uniref:Na+/H+ antiporter subunit D n=1 Tax=unclassified Aquipuribacter TaxID=2635084 RepID=UPI003EE9287F